MTEQKQLPMEKAPTPKYEIGQRVLVAHWTTEEIREVCPDCGGSKVVKLVLASGEELEAQCRHCTVGYQARGYVTKSVYVPRVWHGTVGSIKVDTHDESPVSYMLEETGVGTGSVHREETLFLDAEEAARAAARKAKRQQELINRKNDEQRKSRRLKDLSYRERWERHSRELLTAVRELIEGDHVAFDSSQRKRAAELRRKLIRLLGWIKPEEY
jgi:hypothetical protein